MNTKWLLLIMLLLTGCQNLDRLINGKDSEEETHNVFGAGQSNANNPIIWTRIAEKMRETGRESNANYFAKSNTDSAYWANNTDRILDGLESAVRIAQPSKLMWMQGEGDKFTEPEVYAQNLEVIFNRVRRAAPGVKIYIALESYNEDDLLGGSKKTRQGQELAIRKGLGFRGIDVDKFRTPECSPEGLHFYDECKIKIADAWFNHINSN